MADDDRALVFTIGHSTRTTEDLVSLLKTQGVTLLVDVRTVPKSRRNPQFTQEALSGSLQAQGIRYAHMRELGGLRHPQRDSINTGWQTPGFRGYADYMATAEFAAALQRLIDMVGGDRLAVMCAEAVPWRCHRSLISDALCVAGVQVEHILSGKRTYAHKLTPFAHVEDGRITYPAPPEKR